MPGRKMLQKHLPSQGFEIETDGNKTVLFTTALHLGYVNLMGNTSNSFMQILYSD
jgi:hypothetical protein